MPFAEHLPNPLPNAIDIPPWDGPLLVVKYALVGCLVGLGIIAYNKRDDVIDAFHWSPAAERQALPAFDPKAVAEANALEVPRSAITVITAPDTRTVAVPTVPPDAAAPIRLTGGRTTLDGVVLGPGGAAVPGATVRIERLVGDGGGVLDITANATGAWSAGQLLGGRYRIRAWRAPTHAQTSAEVTFVEDGERRSFKLQLEAPSEVEFATSLTGDKIIVGQSATVTARVRAAFVNGQGQIGIGGRPGDTIVVTATGVFAGQGGTKATDGNGLVAFPINCGAQLGTGTITVTGVSQTKSYDVACVPVPTTTTAAPTTTTAPGTPNGVPATTTTKAG